LLCTDQASAEKCSDLLRKGGWQMKQEQTQASTKMNGHTGAYKGMQGHAIGNADLLFSNLCFV